MTSFRDFIKFLSSYINHSDLMIIQSGLYVVSVKYSKGELSESDLERGSRKLCKMLYLALGDKVLEIEKAVGANFDEWCVESVKNVISGNIESMSPKSIMNMFTGGVEGERGRERGMGIL